MLCWSLGGWSVPGIGLGLFLQGIPHSQPVPLLCACDTVVLVGLSERSRMAFTLGIVPGPSPPWLYKHSKKIFLCYSVLIVTRSGSIRQQRLMRVVLYKTITIRTLTSLKYFVVVHWEKWGKRPPLYTGPTCYVPWRARLLVVMPDKLQHVKTCCTM